MKRIVLIAETDEDRRLVALWRAGGGHGAPRVIRDPGEGLRLLAKAELSGVSRKAAESWLSVWRDGTGTGARPH